MEEKIKQYMVTLDESIITRLKEMEPNINLSKRIRDLLKASLYISPEISIYDYQQFSTKIDERKEKIAKLKIEIQELEAAKNTLSEKKKQEEHEKELQIEQEELQKNKCAYCQGDTRGELKRISILGGKGWLHQGCFLSGDKNSINRILKGDIK